MLRIALALAGLVVVLLVVAQLVLPGVAERLLADELRATGEVRSVNVESFPAVKLLGRRADRVEVRLGAGNTGQGEIGDLIERTKETDELDARVESLTVGRFAMRDLRLTKDGGALSGEAGLTDEALRAALPETVSFKPLDTGDGDLVLEVTAGLLGVEATVPARLSARDGALIVAPEGIPFGGLATLTVFEDPRVNVTEVGARRTGDGYVVTATGTPGS